MTPASSQETPFGFEPDVPTQSRGAKDSFPSQLKRVITAATLLVIAYIIVFIIHQYVTGLLAMSFGYSPIITFNRIDGLPNDYREWSLRKITFIFSSGPLLCLIIGIFSLDFFNSLTGKGNLWRCFILWFTMCSLNLFLAHMLLSPIAVNNYDSDLYTGFSIVGAWWRIGKLLMIPLSFVALTGSILVGYIANSMFIKFSFSKTKIDSLGGRRKMLLQLYVVPVLVAAPIVISLTNSHSLPLHLFHFANLLLMAIGMFIGSETLSRDIRVYGKDVLNTIPVIWLAIAGGLISLVLFVMK